MLAGAWAHGQSPVPTPPLAAAWAGVGAAAVTAHLNIGHEMVHNTVPELKSDTGHD